MNNSTSVEQTLLITDVSILWRNVLVGAVLVATMVLTVLGNLLVVFAVLREHHMRSNLTNRFLVSLAVADLLMGSVVMPFALMHTLRDGYWSFGRDWCDLWHAFDVLSSTASILNLCAIAIERFWATENPISYASQKTRRRCTIMLVSVWICSAAISFPAVAWWRRTDDYFEDGPTECHFTYDRAYLICSSLVSFYIPLVVMTSVYVKIYRTATKLIRSLQIGEKVVPCKVNKTSRLKALQRVTRSKGTQGHNILSTMSRLENPVDKVILRIHRGCRPKPNVTVCKPTNGVSRDGSVQGNSTPIGQRISVLLNAANPSPSSVPSVNGFICGNCQGCLSTGMVPEFGSDKSLFGNVRRLGPDQMITTAVPVPVGVNKTASNHSSSNTNIRNNNNNNNNNNNSNTIGVNPNSHGAPRNSYPSLISRATRACVTCCCPVKANMNQSIQERTHLGPIPGEEDLAYGELVKCGQITSQPSVARLVMHNTPESGQSRAKQWVNRLRIFAATTRISKYVREQKAAKTLGLVMGLFIGCWLPFFVCNIIVAFNPELVIKNVTFQHVLIVVTWLGYVNSCINPIIYAHSMREFRRAFKRLLCSWWWNYANQKRLRDGKGRRLYGTHRLNGTSNVVARLERHTINEVKFGQLDCLELANKQTRPDETTHRLEVHVSTCSNGYRVATQGQPGQTSTHLHLFGSNINNMHTDALTTKNFVIKTGGMYSGPPSLVHQPNLSPVFLGQRTANEKPRVLSASNIPYSPSSSLSSTSVTSPRGQARVRGRAKTPAPESLPSPGKRFHNNLDRICTEATF
ncbi:Dopamine receptor 2 [Fasciolopsis buskii]|uniref:Dopamine receptor 2 n=1 Tax=Fasciolopsis buskii TaxID=27845 RepID=A0A8E0RZ19_9TREM|nr:Dopamine receptor 2 [Fasciolopsis buski]